MDVNKFLRKSLLCQLLASESLKALEERVGMRRQSLGTQQTKKERKKQESHALCVRTVTRMEYYFSFFKRQLRRVEKSCRVKKIGDS